MTAGRSLGLHVPMPNSGIAFAVWCTGIAMLVALSRLSGRASKAITAWVAVLLSGLVLAVVWL